MHLDLAWNAVFWDRDLTVAAADLRRRERASGRRGPGWGTGTVTLPDLRTGQVGVVAGTLLARYDRVRPPVPADPPSGFSSAETAHAAAVGQLAWYRTQERRGNLRTLTDLAGLEQHVRLWQQYATHNPTAGDPPPVGVILSMEGADPILAPSDVADWWAAGLRMLSLSHYGDGRYSHGTDSPGPIHPAARPLLAEMERVGMTLDVTHLADEAMDEAFAAFGGPVLASHHNCRALVDNQRQLRDRDIRAVVERDGVIGVAFDNWMLDPGCGQTGTTSVRRTATLEDVADHIDHICQLAGSASHAALGTDLDGGFGCEQSPREIDTIADLQLVPEVLARRGYSSADIRGVMHENWIRFFRRAWRSSEKTAQAVKSVLPVTVGPMVLSPGWQSIKT